MRVGCINNNDYDYYNYNNKQICIAPLGPNFKGAGTRQRVNEQRKERKPGRRGLLRRIDLTGRRKQNEAPNYEKRFFFHDIHRQASLN